MSDQNMQVTSTNKPVVATTLIAGDQISVNLVATKPDGARMSAGGLFNHIGNAIQSDGKELPGISGLNIALLSGSAAPEFPAAKHQELIEQGSTEAAEDLVLQHEMDVAAWEEQGNKSLPDSIADAALDWADRVHGVKTTDGDHPVIKPESVVVKNVTRENAQQPGVFIVQLTPSWG